MQKYKVDLVVLGDISIINHIEFDTDKELDIGDVFTSKVQIKQYGEGVQISPIVYTADEERAHKVALIFIGSMLDVLSVKKNKALIVEYKDHSKGFKGNPVKLIVERDEFESAFSIARKLNHEYPTFLRALNWYRKGLYTSDPIDKYLAYWNTVCVLAGKYHEKNPRTELGIINQIYDCFNTLWSEDQSIWPNINGEVEWIDKNNDLRNDIAHGLKIIDVRYIDKILERLPTVQNVAYKFICDIAKIKLEVNLLE